MLRIIARLTALALALLAVPVAVAEHRLHVLVNWPEATTTELVTGLGLLMGYLITCSVMAVTLLLVRFVRNGVRQPDGDQAQV